MDKEILLLIENSGLKKKFIAEKIGVTPSYLYMCMVGQRTLSRKKESKLNQLLSINLNIA